jgi:hypothetical protein
MALRAALPVNGILRKSPRFLASILAILARALIKRLCSMAFSKSVASGLSGERRVMVGSNEKPR